MGQGNCYRGTDTFSSSMQDRSQSTMYLDRGKLEVGKVTWQCTPDPLDERDVGRRGTATENPVRGRLTDADTFPHVRWRHAQERLAFFYGQS